MMFATGYLHEKRSEPPSGKEEVFFLLRLFVLQTSQNIFVAFLHAHLHGPHPSKAVFGSGGNCKGILKAQPGVNENT